MTNKCNNPASFLCIDTRPGQFEIGRSAAGTAALHRPISTEQARLREERSICPKPADIFRTPEPRNAYPLSRRRIGCWIHGQPLSQLALRSRFDKARQLAGVEFQFRDIRAKAATDTGDLAHSQKLLAHKNREMTEHYVRARKGDRVKPLR